jgi:hypothetical protein
MATGLIAGLGPARYGWRGNLLSALQSERAGSSGASAPTRLRSILIGAQATACVVLLVMAALLARSAVQAAGFNTGVTIDRLVHVSPNFGRGYGRRAKARVLDGRAAAYRGAAGRYRRRSRGRGTLPLWSRHDDTDRVNERRTIARAAKRGDP